MNQSLIVGSDSASALAGGLGFQERKLLRREQHALFAQALDERRAVEMKHLRRHRLVAAAALQGLLNETVFDPLQNTVEVDAVLGVS